MNGAPEWGVMFHDGSVMHPWNGRTQRQRAESAAARYRVEYPGDRITLAYRGPDGVWVRVE